MVVWCLLLLFGMLVVCCLCLVVDAVVDAVWYVFVCCLVFVCYCLVCLLTLKVPWRQARHMRENELLRLAETSGSLS